MASGISFSGFNNIDFNVVLNAIMTQESQPLTALQAQQRALQTTDSNYATLATKLATLQSATDALSDATTFTKYSASTSDPTAVTTSATSTATAGRYELAVTSLARTQTSVSSSFAADVDTTIVATGGTLTIGGTDVTLSGPVTLQQLAAAINATDDAPATASIVETTPGKFRLVLTGKNTGADNAFTVDVSGLTGNSLAFANPPVVAAANAQLTINGVAIESASNTLASGIPGVSVTLLKESATTVVNVGQDSDDLVSRVNAFAAAYNDLVKFSNDQTTAANNGSDGTLGRDSLLKTLRGSLRNALVTLQGSGTFKSLAEVGIGFNRSGQITVDASALKEALTTDTGAVRDLFTNATTGAFKSVGSILDNYTQAGGFVSGARSRISDDLTRLAKRSDDLAARLATRRAALQQQFIAADEAMTRLKSQQGALSGFSTDLVSNTP